MMLLPELGATVNPEHDDGTLPRLFVAIEGATGVGKTTLAERLAPALDARLVLDPFEDNPFLERMLYGAAGDEPAALRTELTFLALRVAQLREVHRTLLSGRSVVADWAMLKQHVFAATTLPAEDIAPLRASVDLWSQRLPVPDVLVAMTASATVLSRRVRQRGRPMESAVSSDALGSLASAFDSAFLAWPGPLVRLDADEFDAYNPQHIAELANHIRQHMIPLEVQ